MAWPVRQRHAAACLQVGIHADWCLAECRCRHEWRPTGHARDPTTRGILARFGTPHRKAMATIQVRGARTHNLKNVDLDIPRDQLIVITGLSGSGKSSLAFDTLYAEGQRRYVESLSTYARQFLSVMEKPDVDHIEGLSPAISIEQKSTSHNPRSTVGTITEIYDYLRLLFARAGEPRCPQHGLPLAAQTVSQMVDAVLALPEGAKLMLLAPVVRERKGEHAQLLEQLRGSGFVRVRVDGRVAELDDVPALDKQRKHTIEVVVDRFRVRADLGLRLAESFETALGLAEGLAIIAPMDEPGEEQVFSARFACPHCGHSIPATGAAAVLVQQPRRRLPELRRPRGAAVLRRGAHRAEPRREPGAGRDPRLGPAQRLLLPPARLAGRALRLQPRHALRGTGARAPRARCSTAAARRPSASTT